MVSKVTYYGYNKQKEKEQVDTFFEVHPQKKKSSYIAIIEIPKIHLKRGLVDINHPDNTVDENIQVIFPSNMPDVINGNLILAGHSGTGKKAFFKDLNKLQINDFVNIYYKDKKYTYKLVHIYEERKDGDIKVKRNPNRTTLTLITCKPNSKDKQIVLILELTEKTTLFSNISSFLAIFLYPFDFLK